MNWKTKARLLAGLSKVPGYERYYICLQKAFGRLKANPTARLGQTKMLLTWLKEANPQLIRGRYFEVGTGHIPRVPLFLYLAGASSVVTVDLNRRLDLRMLGKCLQWVADNPDTIVRELNQYATENEILSRIEVVRENISDPGRFLSEAKIEYVAPARAESTGLPAGSIDVHFSVTTFEHIPSDVLSAIMVDAKRLLNKDGVAFHRIDLSDHFSHCDPSIMAINFLKFREGEFSKYNNNALAYCNRLRKTSYDKIFRDAGFEDLRVETHVDELSLKGLRSGFVVSEEFAGKSETDICTTSVTLILKEKV